MVDCPLDPACAPSFSVGGNFSLAVSLAGDLFVLDGAAGKLFLVTP